MQIKKITKDNINEVVEQEGFGFDKEQLSKLKRFLKARNFNFSGKFCSNGSGGNFYHMFFQLKDFTWIGYHNGSGDFTMSKPFKTAKSLYNAFWEDEDNVCIPYRKEKIKKADYLKALEIVEQYCKEKNCDVSVLYPRGK